MSTLAWIILLVIVIPMVGLLAWVIISASIVRIPPGSLGLLLERGRPTDTVLTPGPHFVFTLRRRTVEEYPAVELAYRAGSTDDAAGSALEMAGPALRLTLGDRTVASVPYTVRFRLRTDQLRLVHERFGASGIFGIVRDESSRTVTTVMGDPAVTVDHLFGPAREQCQETVAAAVRERLQRDGIDVTEFVLGAVDLGRTGEVIQATVRARHELAQEQAEAATRLARALNDADLQVRANPAGEAWRYRETDLLRDLVQRREALQVAVHGAGAGRLGMIGTAPPLPDQPPT
jgi:regulator of protease activity HflC (stomatin/prohibitin superfamily)